MKRVDPIRNLDLFYEMQKQMMSDGKIKECLLLILMFNTNLRVSDALLIKWRDVIDPEDGSIVNNLVISEKKTRKNKWLPITKQLKTALLNYYVKYNPKRSDFIFRSVSNRIQRRNQSWTRQYVCSTFKKYAKKVGIKDNIGSHSPRKTWGYHAYRSGMLKEEIKRILNHSDIRQTEIYCGIDDDLTRDNYEFVSRLNKRADNLIRRENLPDEYRSIRPVFKRRKKKK
ncbi:MAG: tyrosine-type recombinase/integrase [Bacteroidales bacterium]|nr:tyrosine-type recombinase/integrase [Bacteroidales bacterium]